MPIWLRTASVFVKARRVEEGRGTLFGRLRIERGGKGRSLYPTERQGDRTEGDGNERYYEIWRKEGQKGNGVWWALRKGG